MRLKLNKTQMKNNIKYLYCGNIFPPQLITDLKLPVAGNKYEVSLIKNLNEIWGDSLDVISTRNLGKAKNEIKDFKYLFEKKEFKHIKTINIPIIRDFAKFISLLSSFTLWALKNKNMQKKIIVLNSSFSVTVISILMKIFFKSYIFSLKIDTPYPNFNSKIKIYEIYQTLKFKIGDFLLRFFDGIIVLNKTVIKSLKLKIPFIVSKIGYDESFYNDNIHVYKIHLDKKKIVFAGTLIQYNGIIELLDGFALLDKNDFELHIYGSGPLESYVLNYCEKHENIYFHGLIDNELLLKKFLESDLLINPRITSSGVNDFGFPSKLIEYILSGVPVLTTEFGSIPNEYKSFLHFIRDETPKGIKSAIINVFENDENYLNDMCVRGIQYIRNNNSWNLIAHDIHSFIINIGTDRLKK